MPLPTGPNPCLLCRQLNLANHALSEGCSWHHGAGSEGLWQTPNPAGLLGGLSTASYHKPHSVSRCQGKDEKQGTDDVEDLETWHMHTSTHMHIGVCITHTHTQLESRLDTCCFSLSSYHLPFSDDRTLLLWELSLFQPNLSITGHDPNGHVVPPPLHNGEALCLSQSELFGGCPLSCL